MLNGFYWAQIVVLNEGCQVFVQFVRVLGFNDWSARESFLHLGQFVKNVDGQAQLDFDGVKFAEVVLVLLEEEQRFWLGIRFADICRRLVGVKLGCGLQRRSRFGIVSFQLTAFFGLRFRDFVEVTVFTIQNVSHLINSLHEIFDQVVQVLVRHDVSTGAFLDGMVDEVYNSQAHLRIVLESAGVEQRLQQMELLSEDKFTIALDKNVGDSEHGVLECLLT